MQAIFAAGFLPSAVEIADHFTLEARGATWARRSCPGATRICLSNSTARESVRSEIAAFANCSRRESQTRSDGHGETDARLWELRREFSNSLRATGLTKLNEDIVVPRSQLVDLVEFAEKLQAKHGFPIACFGHAGDGNIHVNIMVDRTIATRRARKSRAALDELFAQVLAWGGVITGEHGIGLAKKRWWPQATSDVARELHRRLKKALDPHDILNPGKFVDDENSRTRGWKPATDLPFQGEVTHTHQFLLPESNQNHGYSIIFSA